MAIYKQDILRNLPTTLQKISVSLPPQKESIRYIIGDLKELLKRFCLSAKRSPLLNVRFKHLGVASHLSVILTLLDIFNSFVNSPFPGLVTLLWLSSSNERSKCYEMFSACFLRYKLLACNQ